TALFGEKYARTRKYRTKSKGAQEAHEAIRPTYIDKQEVAGDAAQKRLYELIWKRTVASQMSDAELERTQITIAMSGNTVPFVAKGEVVTFDGFLKLYIESVDDDGENGSEARLPQVKNGQPLLYDSIAAEQRYTQHPPRYSEASLVKKMEELGIGRPSTYSPTISTIQKREYVVKADREGEVRPIVEITLKNGKISRDEKKEKSGAEKGKLFPTDLGTLVNRFLEQYFSDVIDYHFTAEVEKSFDEIALGKAPWNRMISSFHQKFHKKVEETNETAQRFSGEKLLGIDPESGRKVFVKIGRYGPMAQIGETESNGPLRFAGLLKNQSIDSITLVEALELFRFPKEIGEFEEKPMTVAVGRFGPYVKHDNKFYSLAKGEDPANVSQVRGVEIILAKREKDLSNIIRTFDEKPGLVILNGRFGPYISYQKNNYKIPKGKDPAALTLADCEGIMAAQSSKSKPAKTSSRSKKK
ncbi:MAG: DNA topoisomerase, partial [Bacteroidales bacterium]